MLQRHIAKNLLIAMQDTPAILLNGARQTGKSTLMKHVAQTHDTTYVNLDDQNSLFAAQHDPVGFITSFTGNIIIDEIQRAPNLFLAIKKAIDQDRKPGKFLLTGSANVLLLPQLADSLAGRMEIYTLWPFSQGEILQRQETFIERIFTKGSQSLSVRDSMDKLDYLPKIIAGGYPEIILTRTEPSRRGAWYEAYLNTILQRDIRDLMQIEGLTQLPPLLELLASRCGTLLNFADIARELGLPQTTLKRYFSLFTTTFLIHLLPAWHDNMAKRLSKAPKLLLGDTGLLCHLLRQNETRLKEETTLLGRIIENFVIMEILKQCSWHPTLIKAYHWRTHDGLEIDLILENTAGQLIAIEIKSSATLEKKDLKALTIFTDQFPTRFCQGIILYTGNQIIAFSEKIAAVPIHTLWAQHDITA